MQEQTAYASDVAMTVAQFQNQIRQHARYSLAKPWEKLTRAELFTAVALSIKQSIVDGMLETEARYVREKVKRIYYLSIEFLPGKLLASNLLNLGIWNLCHEALAGLGVDLVELLEQEPDPGLGNGGLGRLAACFLDSMATLGIPGFGYGINYEFGLFKQEIQNGYQKEEPDNWLAFGTPWIFDREDERLKIPLYGRIEHAHDEEGEYRPRWVDCQEMFGLPTDIPVAGYGGHTVNRLRLFAARASTEFDMNIFNAGDYVKAVEKKISTETVSKLLYPADTQRAGQELRLIQEYFLVACAIRNIVQQYLQHHDNLGSFAEDVAIQLNDTHPALAIAELMRLLMDEQGMKWDQAWEITRPTMGYTNHTLMPEALERWPVSMLEQVLPRHLQIIREINRRFLSEVIERWPGDSQRQARMSILEGENSEQSVRMAHLAIVGSHSINGVAKMHSELIKTSLVPDFHELWPERFHNKTNGVTPRRWLLQANPGLATLISRHIGRRWVTDLERLRGLERHADDPQFQEEFAAIKHRNKQRLADYIESSQQLSIDVDSLYAVQVKRIHEYKRQLLNILNIVHKYLELVEDGKNPPVPCTHIFGGKAAPGYWAAKQVIKLIHSVAEVINNDPRVQSQIRVVFLPDYRVSLAELIIPSANLSEQISTAGKEASGTGNMKFAMNGALTIGTLDGANIELREEIGPENMYSFGLNLAQIREMRHQGQYRPQELYSGSPVVKRVMDALNSDLFCPQEPGLFRWIFQSLVHEGDVYFHLADLASYIEAHEQAAQDYLQPKTWWRKSILNVARIGRFSSDRTIQEYAREVWNVAPCK